MTWNLKHAGIPNNSTVLYDSPFSASSSKYAIGSSKINHGVAQYLYPAENVRKSLNIQSAPLPSKAHSMRYTLDANSVTNFIPGGVLASKDVYEQSIKQMAESYKKESYTITTTINSSDDFRKLAHQNYKLIDEVVRQMMVNSSIILQHKVYGTELPSWYIHKMCFLILLEQAMADEYGDENVNKKAINSPTKALDLILNAYNTANVEKKEKWSLFSRGDEEEQMKLEIATAYNDVSIPEEYRRKGTIQGASKDMNLTEDEKTEIKETISKLNELLAINVPFEMVGNGKDSVEEILDAYAEPYKKMMSSELADEQKVEIAKHIDSLIAKMTPQAVVDVHDEQVVVVPDETTQPVIDDIKEEVVVVDEPDASDIALAPVVRESCMMKLAAVDGELLKLVNSTIYKEKSAPLMVIDAPVKVDNDSKAAAINDEIAKIEAELKKLESKKSGFLVNWQKKILQARLAELKAKLPKEGWINHVHGVVPSWKGVRGRNERYSISGVTHRSPWPERLGVRSFRKENFETKESLVTIILIIVIIVLCIYLYKSMKSTKPVSRNEGGVIWDDF